MTNQEASKIIKDGIEDMSLDFADEEQYEALTMAIKVLEQEPTDRIEYGTDGNAYKLWISNGKEYEPSGDLIRRQAVEDAMYDATRSMDLNYGQIMEYIDKLPPVKQEPKTGHWIEKDGFDGDTYYDCSECGESFCLIDGTPTDNLYNYCPNCGCAMKGDTE